MLAPNRSVLGGIISACAIAAAASWALRNLGPASELVGGWSSDAAIPVLMSNLDRFTLFEAYYLGQDRFGAVAFLLCSLVHRATGFVWTPERLAILQALTIMSSAVAVGLLLRPRAMFAVIWALILVLFPWRFHLFDLCQPYGWQLTALLFAWVALRRLRERAIEGGRSFGLFVGAVGLCFLASWISSFSAPLLLCVAVAEGLAAGGPRASWFQSGTDARNGFQSGTASAWRVQLLLAAAVVCGGGLEGVLRGVYQGYAKATFGRSYHTSLDLRLPGAADALVEALDRLELGGGAALFAFACVAALVGLVVAIRVRRARGGEGLHPNLVALLGLAAIAVAMVIIPPLISHFQRNGLYEKYFTLPAYFSALAAVIALERVASWLPKRALQAVGVGAWGGASALAVSLFAWHPPAGLRPEFSEHRRLARELARRSPGAFIVSGYWDVYDLAALALPDRLRPYPFDGQMQRMPFLRSELAAAEAVWVSDEGSDGKPLPPIGPTILVGGVPLEPSGEPPLHLGSRRFIAYHSALQSSR